MRRTIWTVNAVFGVARPAISGEFSNANPTLAGAFHGLFAGPSAQELMARRSADFVNPFTVSAIVAPPEVRKGRFGTLTNVVKSQYRRTCQASRAGALLTAFHPLRELGVSAEP